MIKVFEYLPENVLTLESLLCILDNVSILADFIVPPLWVGGNLSLGLYVWWGDWPKHCT